jgi:hypothetical protein
MKKEQIKEIAMDLNNKVSPEYTYRFWDAKNSRTLLATGANLVDYPEEAVIFCVEENQQICLSSLDLIKPESQIYFQSKLKKDFNAKEALEKVNKHIDTIKELIRQMEMFEKLKEIHGKK